LTVPRSTWGEASPTPNTAQIRCADLPNGARGYLVDCAYDYTKTEAPPEMVTSLGDAAIARITAYRHHLECGRCDMEVVWDQVGRESESLAEIREAIAHVQQVAAKARQN
jgi:hypothetical protein